MRSLDELFVCRINRNPESRNAAYIFVIVTMSSLLGVLFAYVLTSMMLSLDTTTADKIEPLSTVATTTTITQNDRNDNIIRKSTLLSR